jgi:dTDP-4-amino-4,6-dideoxygalactose transaminase
MRIPFLDLKRQYSEVEAEISITLAGVLGGGSYVLGGEVEGFEAEWARFCGVRGAASLNSGTDALTLALMASGAVRQGGSDEVITAPLSPGYTALAVIRAGGVPIFADIDPHRYTIDPEAIEKLITPRTRAIVPVHLYGQMADMKAITEIASRHGLVVIEDAAQAHGASINGKRAGAYGQAAAFSFYPTKNLGAYGDSGAVTSDDLELIERVKILRQGGHPAGIQTKIAGCNSRLDEVQAAVLRVKLKYLLDWNRRRKDLARVYDEAFKGSGIESPLVGDPETHAFHLYVIQHPEREQLRKQLLEKGIETMIHYPFLLHQQLLFRSKDQPATLPVAERVVKRIISLPLYPQLSLEEVQEVASEILAFGN